MMQLIRGSMMLALVVASALVGAAQNPPAGTTPVVQPGNASPTAPGGPGGRGRGGRGGVQVMTLTTTAWPDGGMIPVKHTQVGAEVSPALAWSNVPDNTQSFVLMVHDVDAAVGNGTDDVLHWMLWNIPAATRSLPEGVPRGRSSPTAHDRSARAARTIADPARRPRARRTTTSSSCMRSTRRSTCRRSGSRRR